MNKRGHLIQGSVGCPQHLREWRGNQSERLLQSPDENAGSRIVNQTATLLDAREEEVGHKRAPFGN